MITDPVLLFIIQYVDTMTNPLNQIEIREQLSYQIAFAQVQRDQSPFRLDSLIERAIASYVQLQESDHAIISQNVHLWLIQRIRDLSIQAKFDKSEPIVTEQQLISLYGKIDIPLVRYSLIDLLNDMQTNYLSWMNQILRSLKSRNEHEGFAMILLDLRLYDYLLFWIDQHPDIDIREFLKIRRDYISGNSAQKLRDRLDIK